MYKRNRLKIPLRRKKCFCLPVLENAKHNHSHNFTFLNCCQSLIAGFLFWNNSGQVGNITDKYNTFCNTLKIFYQ